MTHAYITKWFWLFSFLSFSFGVASTALFILSRNASLKEKAVLPFLTCVSFCLIGFMLTATTSRPWLALTIPTTAIFIFFIIRSKDKLSAAVIRYADFDRNSNLMNSLIINYVNSEERAYDIETTLNGDCTEWRGLLIDTYNEKHLTERLFRTPKDAIDAAHEISKQLWWDDETIPKEVQFLATKVDICQTIEYQEWVKGEEEDLRKRPVGFLIDELASRDESIASLVHAFEYPQMKVPQSSPTILQANSQLDDSRDDIPF